MTKQEVCMSIDSLWVSRTQRHQLKYRINTRTFTQDELDSWGEQFKRAGEMQQKLLATHAFEASHSPAVYALEKEYNGMELAKKKRVLAGKLLRQHVRKESGLAVPADLSRHAVETHL